MAVLETKTILITVKAPPNPSKKYQETNCCVGIDLANGQFIRLYPIPFRLLQDSQKFPKYSIIQVKCQKPVRDKRVESYKVDQDSIKVLEHLGTANKWAKRKSIVLPADNLSFCQILREVKDKKSLGLFKPFNVEFEIKKSTKSTDKKYTNAYGQYWLFDKKLRPLEKIPFDFYYKFKCLQEKECSGHILKIHDWELVASYRTWRYRYREQKVLLEKITQKWLEISGPKKDVYFYVGNMWQHPKQFLVLGVFYPPK